jgi:hypothetical protein
MLVYGSIIYYFTYVHPGTFQVCSCNLYHFSYPTCHFNHIRSRPGFLLHCRCYALSFLFDGIDASLVKVMTSRLCKAIFDTAGRNEAGHRAHWHPVLCIFGIPSLSHDNTSKCRNPRRFADLQLMFHQSSTPTMVG